MRPQPTKSIVIGSERESPRPPEAAVAATGTRATTSKVDKENLFMCVITIRADPSEENAPHLWASPKLS